MRVNAIYFYNALSKPIFICKSIKTLMNNIYLTDSYRGDISSELSDVVNNISNSSDPSEIREALSYFDIFYFSELKEFVAKNRQVGLDDMCYLSDLIQKYGLEA